MGTNGLDVDFPGMITAAAKSPLGVLSLCCLVIAFLAYSLFKASGDKTKLIVFVLVFGAVVAFGSALVMQTKTSPPPSKVDTTQIPKSPSNNTLQGVITPYHSAEKRLSPPPPSKEVKRGSSSLPEREDSTPPLARNPPQDLVSSANQMLPITQPIDTTRMGDRVVGALRISSVTKNIEGFTVNADFTLDDESTTHSAFEGDNASLKIIKDWACGDGGLSSLASTNASARVRLRLTGSHGTQDETLPLDCESAGGLWK